MKTPTFKSFSWGFTKDWVAPKVGTAYVVWQMFEIIWKSNNEESINRLMKSVEKYGSPWFFGLILVLGTVFVGTLIAKFIVPRDPSRRWMLRYIPSGTIMANILNFAVGSLTVPISILMCLAIELGLDREAWIFAINIFIFVFVGGCLYWVAEQEKNSAEELAIWQVRLPQNVNGDAVCEVLNVHFKDLESVVEDAQIIYARPRHAVIALMLLTPVRKWSDAEVSKFKELLRKSSTEIANKIPGAKIRSKHPSDEIELAFKQRG